MAEDLVTIVFGDIDVVPLENSPAEIVFEAANGAIEIQYFGNEAPTLQLTSLGPPGPQGDITPALTALRDQAQTAAATADARAADAEDAAVTAANSATVAATSKNESVAAQQAAEAAAADAELSKTATATSEAIAVAAQQAAEAAAADADDSQSSAATSAANAATSATNSLASEQSASDSATAAASSAQTAQNAEQLAEDILAQFRDAFLGLQAADPITDLNGDPLDGGEIYVNSTSGRLRFYNGTGWADVGITEPEVAAQIQAAIDALISGAGSALDTLAEIADALGNDPDFAATMTTAIAAKLAKDQNLADVADVAAARANIGANNASNLTTGALPAARFTDTSHGNRGGGALHAVATQAAAGFMSAADKTKLDTLDLGDDTQIEIANAALKDTPVDGDSVALVDSASGNALKRTTWARVKATLKTYFDTVYSAVGHTHTKAQITDFAHSHGIGDLPVATSGASNATQLVRADDARLSNARTPLAHVHDPDDVTGLQALLDGKLGATATATAAAKLQTARTFTLTGDVSGSVSFNGTANVSITAVVADDSHNHIIANIDGLSAALAAKLDANAQAVDAEKLGGLAPAEAATASTIAQRSSNGDITARYLVGQYVSMSHAAAVRNTDTVFYSSTDNYVRKNTKAGFKTSLGITIADVANLQTALDTMGNGVPVGAIMDFPINSIPAGWLVADGSTFSASLYPDLATYLGGNVLPDYTDRVRRMAGPLAGAAGSTQEDAFQGHGHNYEASGGQRGVASPNGQTDIISGGGTNTVLTDRVKEAITDGVNGIPRIASETRVKAGIVITCIKAASVVVTEGMADLSALLTGIADQATAEAGLDNTKLMTPKATRYEIEKFSGHRVRLSDVMTTSGTAFDFAIDPDATEIVLDLASIGFSAADAAVVQLGTPSGFVTANYDQFLYFSVAGSSATGPTSDGFLLGFAAANRTPNGTLRLRRIGTSNTWTAAFNSGSNTGESNGMFGGGSVDLPDRITQLRLTRRGGASFNFGRISLEYRT